jgi:hypothetical protein
MRFAPERIASYLLSWEPFFRGQQELLEEACPVAAQAWAEAWADLDSFSRRMGAGGLVAAEDWEEDLLAAFDTTESFPDIPDRRVEGFAALRRLFDAFASLVRSQQLTSPEYEAVSRSAAALDDLSDITDLAVQALLRGRPVPPIDAIEREYEGLRRVREGIL